MMNRVSVIGLGMSLNDLTADHLSIISQSDVLIGGVRHLAFFPDFKGEKREITDNLKEIVAYIHKHRDCCKITVVASGDPLFYGIGGYLSKKIGRDAICVYPNISSASAAFARIGESWQDAELISFHGRKITPVHCEKLRTCTKAALLTDGIQSPSWLYSELKKEGISGFTLCVLEKMGDKDEQINWFKGDEILKKDFQEPNIVLLLRDEKSGEAFSADNSESLGFGMPETRFQHEKGLITKPEVRAVTLSKLRLASHHTLWDLGAGSGSVSIEASSFIRAGQIIAVEKNENRIRDIIFNRDKFGIRNMEIVHSELPQGLEELPAPDRIFIGGGGKHVSELVKHSALSLKDGGILVVNTVLLGSVTLVLEMLENLNFNTEIAQVQVSCGHQMPWSLMLKSQNPVFIISGEKR